MTKRLYYIRFVELVIDSNIKNQANFCMFAIIWLSGFRVLILFSSTIDHPMAPTLCFEFLCVIPFDRAEFWCHTVLNE